MLNSFQHLLQQTLKQVQGDIIIRTNTIIKLNHDETEQKD